jgi:hypothetical protein
VAVAAKEAELNSTGARIYERWPELPLDAWQATYDTLHMWTQIVGKIRMELTPTVNHYWNVPLYVNARGLTTSLIPYSAATFELWFDFIDQKLVLQQSNGRREELALVPRTTADFYKEVKRMLEVADIDVRIWPMPVEVADPIPFDRDVTHRSYDAAAVQKFWRILLSVQCVFDEFRSKFIGKSSPVHFFWGSFDLALTRFSGRRAPERPGADKVTKEAYSHEVSSVGFWPGGGDIQGAAFYSYAAPEPQGFREARVSPASAKYDAKLGEFILMYDDIRTSASPDSDLLEFCQRTYEAAAENGKWDRSSLERAA